MFRYVYVLLAVYILCDIQYQNVMINCIDSTTSATDTINATTYVKSKVTSDRMIMITGILFGVGLFIGFLSFLITFIWCCKPNNISNTNNRNKILFPNEDVTKIWSLNLENENIQEYTTSPNLSYDINTDHYDKKTLSISFSGEIHSLTDSCTTINTK
ncbi:hypothetical protein MN116_007073 [Schistosoma mekongi]|uniref:Uncharacterized protein n=1 Tax=Schistosoma mekongi TaxID=38744 RepID=A0AAE1Z978_SCHME|nr:hypothetical protein MN116_007073 [Schistosoma mekongi]